MGGSGITAEIINVALKGTILRRHTGKTRGRIVDYYEVGWWFGTGARVGIVRQSRV